MTGYGLVLRYIKAGSDDLNFGHNFVTRKLVESVSAAALIRS